MRPKYLRVVTLSLYVKKHIYPNYEISKSGAVNLEAPFKIALFRRFFHRGDFE